MTVYRQASSLAALAVAFAVAGCSTGSLPSFGSFGGSSETAPPPPAPAAMPATIRADDLVGRWGLAAFHKPEDRARTESAARGQCGQPYTIAKGPGGGVMMHLYDNPRIQELALKGSQGGVNYIGVGGEPAGSPSDREVVSFDGRVMVLRWIDPEVAGRYGTMVYVRCGAPGTARR
jgi:hypothetical protein